MIYAVSIAILVVAGALVVVFAMVGELAVRIGSTKGLHGDPGPAQPRFDLPIGRATDTWPSTLAPLAELPTSMLLVLSTICSSCASVASELREYQDEQDQMDAIGIDISTGDVSHGIEFVQEYQLADLHHYVDQMGSWVRREFGVTTSPTALVFRQGVLVGGFDFMSISQLRATVGEELELKW